MKLGIEAFIRKIVFGLLLYTLPVQLLQLALAIN